MIGDGQDKAATMAAADGSVAVRWLDWVPAADLPALVASHDVCLGIFGASEGAPRGAEQGVPGGRRGLRDRASDTAPQRRALDGAAVLVPPGDSACWPRSCCGWPVTAAGGPARPAGPPASRGAVHTGADRAPAHSAARHGPRHRYGRPVLGRWHGSVPIDGHGEHMDTSRWRRSRRTPGSATS